MEVVCSMGGTDASSVCLREISYAQWLVFVALCAIRTSARNYQTLDTDEAKWLMRWSAPSVGESSV